MKLLFITLLIAGTTTYAQDILWEKSFGGRHAEYLTDIEPTADYGFIIGGSSLSIKSGNKTDPGSGDLDYWIWKMDEHGSPEWQKSFGGSESDLLQTIKTTSDGGFLLAGTSNSPKGNQKTVQGHGDNDFWIIKLNAKGDEMWQKCYGGIGQDELKTVVLTRDGGYLLAGSSNSSVSIKTGNILEGAKKEKNRGNTDYWLLKIDAEGNEQWQKTYGGQYADQLRDVALTKDGGFIVAGSSNSPTSGDKSQENLGQGGDFWILKLNDKGVMQWQQTIGGESDDQPYAICQTSDMGYVIAGSSSSQTRTSKNGIDLWVIKLAELGDLVWEEAYDIGTTDILTSLIQNQDGTFLLGAYSPLTSGDDDNIDGINDYMAIKISANGEEIWRKSLGSEGEDILSKLAISRDGGYLMAGTSNTEFKGYAYKRKHSARSSAMSPFDKNEQFEVAQKLQQEIDNAINNFASEVNSVVSEQLEAAVDNVNESISSKNDSAFKLGLNAPNGNLLNPTRAGKDGGSNGTDSKVSENIGPKSGTKISRDKQISYGGKDFWVVKIKDREKPLKEKVKVEAIPNPAEAYTNVIVGFDFDSGTARVYDIGGRELQNFPIDTRTVPVNLSNYPIGIYIVNIITNKGEGSVKVIKN